MRDRYKPLVILLLIVSLKFSVGYSDTSSFEIDVAATVYRVVDGDTFDAFPVGRIRLADVNAPELNEAGGINAKNALTSLLMGRKVYLDVDDRYVTDRYGRLVCVVYVREDPQKLLNVNKWLVDKNFVSIADYDNEFNPSDWNLYEEYPEEFEASPKTITIIETKTAVLTETQIDTVPLTITIYETIIKEVTVATVITSIYPNTSVKTITTSITLLDFESTTSLIMMALILSMVFLIVFIVRKRR